MYKAIRAFEKTEGDMLSFQEGEEFNFIEEHDQHWWLVQNGKGETGLVPASYLQVNKIVKAEVLESIDRAINLIHGRAAEKGGPLAANDRKNLQKLINHRKLVMNEDSMWASERKPSTSSQITTKQSIPSQPNRPAPQPPSPVKKGKSVKIRRAPAPPSKTELPNTSPSRSAKSLNESHSLLVKNLVPSTFGSEVIEMLTHRFSLRPEIAQAVAITVCHEIGHAVKSVEPLMHKIQDSLQQSHETIRVLKEAVENEDMKKMRKVFEELTKRKDDSQQRGWAIEEDFHVINELLQELIEMTASGDRKVTMKLLVEDDYQYLHNMVVFYQLESRRKLRTTMLQLFGCMCQLKEDVVTQLLCSILPTELAQDLMSEREDVLHLLSTSLMMTMLFSTGEVVPYTHYAQLNRDFIKFVLHGIENPLDIDEMEQIPDSFTGLLLSFNKHLKDPENNVVLSVLSEGEAVRVFSEKILVLLNREEDPAAIFDFPKSFPDSVFKMFMDIFSCKETSKMFFTNDLFVLLDIVLRQITDREAGDEVRTEYISLFHSILRTTDYKEHMYRVEDFRKCLKRIAAEEGQDVEADRYITREIFDSFKDIFR